MKHVIQTKIQKKMFEMAYPGVHRYMLGQIWDEVKQKGMKNLNWHWRAIKVNYNFFDDSEFLRGFATSETYDYILIEGRADDD